LGGKDKKQNFETTGSSTRLSFDNSFF